MAPVTGDLKPSGTAEQQEVKQENGGNEGKTNLLINYLPQCLTEEEFRGIFTFIGPIKSSKIVRQKATGRSYGFGFIDYQDAGDAACAIESLNGLQVLNKRIKVSYARPGGETIKNAKLYVRGIPKEHPPEQTEKMFARFGQIIQFRVIKNESGADNDVAFVLYDLHENAEAAMRALTGTTLPGADQPLVIKYAEPNCKKQKPPAGALSQHSSTPQGATGGGYKYQSHGRNWQKPSKGSHEYKDDMTPVTAVTGGHGLFVYNIGTDTNENSLGRFFGNYGQVINVHIIRNTATGLSRGYGFVTMATYQQCVSAIEALNGLHYAERPLQDSSKERKFYSK